MPKSFHAGGIGVINGISALPAYTHIVGIHFQYHGFDRQGAQAGCQELTRNAITDDDDMIIVAYSFLLEVFGTLGS